MINWVSILIPFFIGIFKYRQFGKDLRFIFYFVVFGTITEIVTRIIIFFGATNTLPVTHFYLMIEFLVLGLFYRDVLWNILPKRIMLIIIVLFEVYCLINTFFLQSVFEYPSVVQAVSKLLLVGFSILFFYKVMIETSVPNLWKEPLIYINIAILVYYSGNLFYSLLFNLILEYSREFSKITVYYFAGLMTLFYILIAVGFWEAGKSPIKLRE